MDRNIAAPPVRPTSGFPQALVRSLKRWLYLFHRWTGIALCLLFALWFFSGVVMMYVGYPKLTTAEFLSHTPVLAMDGVRVTPRQAVDSSGVDSLQELRLTGNAGGRTVYVITPERKSNSPIVVDAISGERLSRFNRNDALLAAKIFFGAEGKVASPPQYRGTIDEDAFTHSKALDHHRPLYLFSGGAEGNTWLYVSSATGEVVRDASASERFWNYPGAWIHWLYPLRGNAFDAYWHDIVVWLSIAGCITGLTGITVGLWRWRRQPYPSGSRSPYRNKLMRWHHITGLIFGLFALTWIFSGLMSMNPWKVFESTAPKLELASYSGSVNRDVLDTAWPVLRHQQDLKEIRWLRAAGTNLILAKDAHAATQVRSAASGEQFTLAPENLVSAARKLLPTSAVQRIDVLSDYDFYYYNRAPHTMLGNAEKPLPVWRIVFNDPWHTWVHIDPRTGAILGRLDDAGRCRRWLFSFLHSFDWLPLLNHRPLWDGLLILLSVGGGIISISGIVIGWRRLRH